MGDSNKDEDFEGKKANADFGQSFGRSIIDTAGNQRRAATVVKNQDKYVEKLQRHVRWGGARGEYAMKVLQSLNEKPAGAPGIVSAESRNAEAMQGARDRQNTGNAVRNQFDDSLNEVNGVPGSNGGTSKDADAVEQAGEKPRVTGQFTPGSELDQTEKDLYSGDPKPDGIGLPDKDGNVITTSDFRDSNNNGHDDKQDWLLRHPEYSRPGKGGQPADGAPSAEPSGTLPTASSSATQGSAENNRKNPVASLIKKFKFGNDLDSISGKDWADPQKNAAILKYGESLGINKDAIDSRVSRQKLPPPPQFNEQGNYSGQTDFRTDDEKKADEDSGYDLKRESEKSKVTDKDREWMDRLKDKPKDAVSRYEAAYNKYQKGIGSKDGAYHEEDYNEMQAIRKGASPAELRVIDRISRGKGSTLSESEREHTEGNYKGSSQSGLDLYNQAINLPRFSESDPNGEKRRIAISNIYGKLNSLDQAKVLASTLERSSAIRAQQIKDGIIDENGEMTAKGLAENKVQYKKKQEVDTIKSNVSKIRNFLK